MPMPKPIHLFKALALTTLACTFTLALGCGAPRPRIERLQAAIPPDSPFAKIRVGMSIKEVYDTIGQPTDVKTFVTGKTFIPFYFGSDGARCVSLYKGQGRIVSSGTGFLGTAGQRVLRIEYDPTEDGYNSR